MRLWDSFCASQTPQEKLRIEVIFEFACTCVSPTTAELGGTSVPFISFRQIQICRLWKLLEPQPAPPFYEVQHDLGSEQSVAHASFAPFCRGRLTAEHSLRLFRRLVFLPVWRVFIASVHHSIGNELGALAVAAWRQFIDHIHDSIKSRFVADRFQR